MTTTDAPAAEANLLEPAGGSGIPGDDIRAADSRAEARKKLPPIGELFPGLRQSIAEAYMFQLTMMAIQRPHFLDALHWWNELLDERDRRYVCRFARQPLDLSELSWVQIEPAQRCRLIAAFMFFREWVNSFTPPLTPFCHGAMEPS